MHKKRRHLPIRTLMEKAGRAIQAIKPVFMMGPMSVAAYVPPGSVAFDLVVFDEASQVKPVDAFGALMRARQAVVVGDSKQLPPTSFFDSVTRGEESTEAEEGTTASVGDMESILSLFLGRGAPERMLRWHYRSQHHSLIAVSNHEFYGSELVVFPSPGGSTRARGLRLRHHPDTVYDRGNTSTNPGEAKHVAEAVMQHARENPDLTLGVVAFSVAQRDAIELQLERLRRADGSLEPFFSLDRREPFFVKNLENVQGDERDMIFISVGYGRAEGGYMPMSFGPLNREGGERRLNVLISRSRLAMDVFCNFRADDLDLARTSARAVASLKNFLAYAERGELSTPRATGREPDSPFEQSVIRALQSRGYNVHPQVGSAGFFIDIGVLDPDAPGRYLIGIECDGAAYHSSRSARDRDRLRQSVLEGLGWRMHRIWSTDWYRNPGKELDRTVAAIERAKALAPPQTPVSPEPQAAVATPDPVPSPAVPVPAVTELPRETVIRAAHSYPAYARADITVPLNGKQLHEIDPEELAKFVVQVVQAESPIHAEEVARRITEAAGLKRTGSRIQDVVTQAAALAVQTKRIARRKDFLWRVDMQDAPVRDRSAVDSNLKKIEYVAPEEIRAALVAEVLRGFSMDVEGAVVAAARVLGFQRVSPAMRQTVLEQVKLLEREGRLKRSGDVLTAAR
jgi:very-short-patch-repair endonuclease